MQWYCGAISPEGYTEKFKLGSSVLPSAIMQNEDTSSITLQRNISTASTMNMNTAIIKIYLKVQSLQKAGFLRQPMNWILSCRISAHRTN